MPQCTTKAKSSTTYDNKLNAQSLFVWNVVQAEERFITA